MKKPFNGKFQFNQLHDGRVFTKNIRSKMDFFKVLDSIFGHSDFEIEVSKNSDELKGCVWALDSNINIKFERIAEIEIKPKTLTIKQCIKVCRVLYSCNNPEQLNQWLKWVQNLKFEDSAKEIILKASEDFRKSRGWTNSEKGHIDGQL